jgi:NAD(P)-dependent dehydrogenase (short-subunit alcohol dehydrogenase family)
MWWGCGRRQPTATTCERDLMRGDPAHWQRAVPNRHHVLVESYTNGRMWWSRGDPPDRRARLVALAGVAGAVLVAREIIARAREAGLTGRTVLIVGGSRGLGLLLARTFAREGARVAICARDVDELERATAWLRDEGCEVLAVACDAADERQVDDLVTRVEERLGNVDVLVNNAAVMHVGSVPQMTVDDFRSAHESTFWAALLPTLRVLPQMRARHEGRIVNITSIGGRLPGPHLAPYTAAKFALVGLSEALRAELAKDGISVTTVVPWFMRTGSYFNATFKEPAQAEFTWFALGASLPLLSVDAERAAVRIVQATKRGEGDVAVGWPAWLAQRFHGLFPGITADLAGLVDQLLPRPDGHPATPGGMRGEIIEPRVPSQLFDALTAWGRAAADRLNERRGPGPAEELRAQVVE